MSIREGRKNETLIEKMKKMGKSGEILKCGCVFVPFRITNLLPITLLNLNLTNKTKHSDLNFEHSCYIQYLMFVNSYRQSCLSSYLLVMLSVLST